MSVESKNQKIHSQIETDVPKPAFWRRRIFVYPAMMLLVVLAIAWFDGGEEPIRPIVQPIAATSDGRVSE